MNNNPLISNTVREAEEPGNNNISGLENLSEILVREYLQKNITRENVSLKHFIGGLEKRIIAFALGLTNGNQKNASRILGIKETSLCEKIKKYDLRKMKKRIPLNLEMLNMNEEEISADLFL